MLEFLKRASVLHTRRTQASTFDALLAWQVSRGTGARLATADERTGGVDAAAGVATTGAATTAATTGAEAAGGATATPDADAGSDAAACCAARSGVSGERANHAATATTASAEIPSSQGLRGLAHVDVARTRDVVAPRMPRHLDRVLERPRRAAPRPWARTGGSARARSTVSLSLQGRPRAWRRTAADPAGRTAIAQSSAASTWLENPGSASCDNGTNSSLRMRAVAGSGGRPVSMK